MKHGAQIQFIAMRRFSSGAVELGKRALERTKYSDELEDVLSVELGESSPKD